MTNQQHTPGPWKAVYRHGVPDYHNIVDSRGIKIAEVFGETNGNGYLIAAAPDMLAALEGLYGLWQGDYNNPQNIAARDAIKKAKGELD